MSGSVAVRFERGCDVAEEERAEAEVHYDDVLDERVAECSFSLIKSSLASSQSICASIAAANSGMGLSREKSRTGMMML